MSKKPSRETCQVTISRDSLLIDAHVDLDQVSRDKSKIDVSFNIRSKSHSPKIYDVSGGKAARKVIDSVLALIKEEIEKK